MKKLLFLFAISMFFVSEGYSQRGDGRAPHDDMRDDVNFGVRAGVNRSNVFDEQGENFAADRKYGFAAGGFVQIPIGTYFGIQPEVLYSQRGFTGTTIMSERQFEYTRNLGFVDVPLLFQIKPSETFYFVAGPQYSLLVRRGTTFESGNLTIEEQNTIRDQSFRRNTIAATGGFDINIEEHFVISGRAGWDLLNNLGSGSATSPRYRNAWVQGTIGLRF